MRLPSPFDPKPWPEADIAFLCETLRVWGPDLPLLAQRQRDALKGISKAVAPLQKALSELLGGSAKKVAPQKNPAFIAAVTALLRWPDLTQAQSFVLGFPVVGDVPYSGVFRALAGTADDMEDPAEWLQREGASVVDDLLTKGPPKDHDVILKVTLEEIQKGFCSPLMSRAEVDKRFGRGRWRPLERFVITQPDGKQRVIDNARKTGHNAHTYMLETIHTVSVDFVASCVRDVFRTLFSNCSDAVPPPCDWMAVRLGTDDLPDAYRGTQSMMTNSALAWFPYGSQALDGCLYWASQPASAFSAFTAAYFDDELSLEFIRDADVCQGGLHLVFSLMGSPPQPSKRFWASADRCYLGTSVHVGSANSLGVRVQPKISSVQKVCAKLDAALESASLSRDEAGKLRGDLQWLFASCNGSAARFAAPVLQRCQYGDNPRLDQRDLLVLRALREMAQMAMPRDIFFWAPPQPSTLVYTDASFEANKLRLGWVVFAQPPLKPIGGTCAVPQAVLEEW
ncbi:unnamed protein product, partial [Symbiodinium sp. CCMP2456]